MTPIRMTRRLRVAIAAALALTGLAQPVTAGSLTPISKIDWAQNQQLEFRWRDDAVPPAWMRSAILDAAAASNASRGAKAAVVNYDAGGQSSFAYTDSLPDPAALAYASRRVPDSFKIWLRPHGYVFDWGTVRWCQFYSSPPDGCFDAGMVTLHELGHVEGLGHIEDAADPGPWLDSIMHTVSRTKPKTGWDADAYGPCDVGAMQVRYELLNASTKVSKCLALASTLSLTASATAVQPGTPVTFSATLRIADSVAYSRLAGDPLSAREVVLQRRTVGGTSWTTYAAMPSAGTAGTYRLSLTPAATYEWRALLSQPDEGLLGDASATLKVTVGCNPYCVE
jgi:hypothetical protein